MTPSLPPPPFCLFLVPLIIASILDLLQIIWISCSPTLPALFDCNLTRSLKGLFAQISLVCSFSFSWQIIFTNPEKIFVLVLVLVLGCNCSLSVVESTIVKLLTVCVSVVTSTSWIGALVHFARLCPDSLQILHLGIDLIFVGAVDRIDKMGCTSVMIVCISFGLAINCLKCCSFANCIVKYNTSIKKQFLNNIVNPHWLQILGPIPIRIGCGFCH